MYRNSHQHQQDHVNNIHQEEMIANGSYLHDQAIGLALLKMLAFPKIIFQHESKMWHRANQIKYG